MRWGKSDIIPIGQAKTSALSFSKDRRLTNKEAAAKAGIHPQSINQWKRRHPECAHWSRDKIIESIVENKDQSKVVARQGIYSNGKRGCFGRLRDDK